MSLLAACATLPTDEEVDATLRRVAASLPDLPADLVVVVVYAEDAEDAWEQIARARQGGPSEVSRALAQSLAHAHPAEDAYVVGGPYASLNEQVLLDALRIVASRGLRGVTALLVSPEEPSRELRESAADMALLLRYRPFPTPEP
jgi:hypothetical protein